MIKKILLGLIALVGIGIAVAWFTVGRGLYGAYRATAPHTAPEDYAQQDDSRIDIPPLQISEAQPYNSLKNVYWGDVHVHTVVSFDAVLFGTTATVEDAYRFAKGEKLRSAGGELMQLSRPLDFVAITDHAESFGLRNRCGGDGLTLIESMNCWVMETPNVLTFSFLRRAAREKVPKSRSRHPPASIRRRREGTRVRRSFRSARAGRVARSDASETATRSGTITSGSPIATTSPASSRRSPPMNSRPVCPIRESTIATSSSTAKTSPPM